MKISKKLKLFVAVLAVLAFSSTGVIFQQLGNMDSNGTVVNYAGIVRGGTQRAIKQELAGMDSTEIIGKTDKIIEGLLTGSEELSLPVPKDDKFISDMTVVKESWEDLKREIISSKDSEDKSMLVEKSESFFEQTNRAVASAEKYSNEDVNTLKTFQLTALVLNLAILAGILWVSVRGISKPINYLIDAVENLNIDEDISAEFTSRSDEVGHLAKGVQKIVEGIREMVINISEDSKSLASLSGQLSDTSNQISVAADEVAKAVDEIANGATSQAEETEVGAATVNQLGDIIADNQDKMVNLNTATEDVDSLKNEGIEVLGDLVKKTDESSSASKEIHGVIVETNQIAQKVSESSQMIRNIADQTNLLALNAAIEAARAGDSGKGFAVVAEEIRKLAEESTSFAEDIMNLIGDLSSMTENAVSTVRAVENIVRDQVDKVDESRLKFSKISESLDNINSILGELNISGESMADKKEELIGLIENLSAISEENAAGTEQAAASVQEQTASMTEIANASGVLSRLSQKMLENVERFA